MYRIRIACLAIVLAAGTACAGVDNAGTTAANFLSVGTGASVLAMGGATLGTGDDLHAAAWNPAALARLGTTQFALSHATLAQLSAQDLAAAGGRVGRGATRWGASVLYQGEGSFDGRDALGVPTGAFNVSSMAVGVQVARPLGNALAAGLGARWLSDNLGDARGTGLALDFGAQAHAGPLGLGVAARNVGGSMTYPSGRFELPAILGLGASWSDAARGLRLALDANFPHAYYNDVRVGGEWRWQDRVALRAGYRMELGAPLGEPLGGPSFGLGAGANGVWMDYAFLAGNADAQGQHRLALTFHPGGLGGRMKPAADARIAEPRFSGAASAEVGLSGVLDAEAHVTEAGPSEAIASESSAPDLSETAIPAAERFAMARTAGAAAAPAVASEQAPAPATPAVAAVAETVAAATPATAPVPRALSALEQLAQDVADRLPPGGIESESAPRELVPLHLLTPSAPVRVEPLAFVKQSSSKDNDADEAAPVAVQPKAAPTVVMRSAASRSTVARAVTPRPLPAPAVVAPPVAPRVVVIRPAGTSGSTAPLVVTRPAPAPAAAPAAAVVRPAAAPVVAPAVAVARPAAAPVVAPPVAVVRPAPVPAAAPAAAVARPAAAPVAAPAVAAARPAAAPVAVARPAVVPVAAAPVAAPLLALNYPVRPARAQRVAPAPAPAPTPAPAAPEVVAPVSAPAPTATPAAAPEPSAPEAQPAAPQAAPEPAKPVKSSPWPSTSATMPRAQYAGSSQKVAVVAVPANAPSTAPITRPAATGPRPAFVNAKSDETLADIASRWDTSVPALMMENNLVNTKLKNGQKLVLPPPLH